MCNHVVAISFRKILSAITRNIVKQIKDLIKDITGLDENLLLATAMQDLVALLVATDLSLEEDKFTMHQGDKIEKFAVGYLVRSIRGIIINIFHLRQALIRKIRDQTNFLSSKLSNPNTYHKF